MATHLLPPRDFIGPLPPSKKVRYNKPMTIAAAFRCMDGVLLGTDTLVTDGYNKSYENKIFECSPFGSSPEVLMAGAGGFPRIKEFADRLIFERTFDDPASSDEITLAIRKAVLWDWYQNEVDQANKAGSNLEFLFTVKDFGGHTGILHLYNTHLYPVPEYYCIGSGAPIATYLSTWLYGVLPIEMSAKLALYILREAKQYSDGCGGDTKLRWLYDGFDDLDTPALSIDEGDFLREIYSHIKPLIYGCVNRKVPDQIFDSHVAHFRDHVHAIRSALLKS